MASNGRINNRTSAVWAGGGGDSERLTFAWFSVPSLDHWNPYTGRWPSGLCLGTAWTTVLQVRCPGDTPISQVHCPGDTPISYSCQKTDIIREAPVSAPWPESGVKAAGRRGPDEAAGRSQGRSHRSGRSPCGGLSGSAQSRRGQKPSVGGRPSAVPGQTRGSPGGTLVSPTSFWLP